MFFFRPRVRLWDRQRKYLTFRARKSAAPSAAKKKQAADANRAPILESVYAPRDKYHQLWARIPLAQGVKFELK